MVRWGSGAGFARFILSAVGNANFVAGEWIPSASGGRFERRGPVAPWSQLGSWPTSGPQDAEAAVAALQQAESWSDVVPDERRARLRVAVRTLDDRADAWRAVGAHVGLRAEEVDHLSRDIAERFEEVLAEIPPGAAHAAGRVSVCAPHWSDLFAGTMVPLAAELARGNRVVLAADPRLPSLADLVADAVVAAGVPAEAVAVLHGMTRDGLATLLRRPEIDALVATGGRERVAWFRQQCTANDITRQVLDLPRCVAAEVGRDDDPAQAARRIVARSFGRGETLGGQQRGQVRRVFCDERVMAGFTECLLAELDGAAWADPLPLIDKQAVMLVQRTWGLGLDEGATLIRGGELVGQADGASDRRVLPTVFTNVEERMALARNPEPMPVICILRVAAQGPRL